MRKFKCIELNQTNGFTEGNIYEIGNDGIIHYDSGNPCLSDVFRINGDKAECWWSKFEEVFDEEIKEDKKVNKFKVGDKVRILNNNDGHGFDIGEIVEVIEDGNQDSLVCKSKENGRDYYLCYRNIDLINQTRTLDRDTMIEKLDEYCFERNCDDCVFRGEYDDFINMKDDELLSSYNLAFENNQSKVVNNSESTFTITTSPSTTTLTDGTHTTTINRYYTDKHNDMVALEEVVKKYKSEMEEIYKDKEIKEAIDKFIKDNNYNVEVELKRKVVK